MTRAVALSLAGVTLIVLTVLCITKGMFNLAVVFAFAAAVAAFM